MQVKGSIIALLIGLMILSALTPLQSIAALKGDPEEKRAEHMLMLAKKAMMRTENFINSLRGNETLMSILENTSLIVAFEGNATLLEQVNATLIDAYNAFESGNYSKAIKLTLEAMEMIRDIFKNINCILEYAGLAMASEEKPEFQAQGLLVAMNRTLERIGRVREVLENLQNRSAISEEDAEYIEELLNNATQYLDLNYIRQLLQQGNVSEAAHRLAEANKLVSKSFKVLKSEAEERLVKRIEMFRIRLEKRIQAMLGNLSQEEINEIMSTINMSSPKDFKDFIKNLINEAKHSAEMKIMMKVREKLMHISEKMRGFARGIYKVRHMPPSSVSENPSLKLSVEVYVSKHHVTLRVTIINDGNVTLVFPNSAYGIIIEKKVNENWVPYYSPISAQILVNLKPGESKEITIKLLFPESGSYRIVAHAWTRLSNMPVESSVEFTIS